MKEKDIEARVCKYARDTYGMLTIKLSSPGSRGVPDRIFVTEQGLIAWIEFKSATGKLTALQTLYCNKLTEHRCEVFLCDDLERGKALVDLLSDARKYTQWKYAQNTGPVPPVPGPSGGAHDNAPTVDAVVGDESGQDGGEPDINRRAH